MNIRLLLDQPQRLACYASASSQEKVIVEFACDSLRLIVTLPFMRRPANWAYGLIAEDYRLWVFKRMTSTYYWK